MYNNTSLSQKLMNDGVVSTPHSMKILCCVCRSSTKSQSSICCCWRSLPPCAPFFDLFSFFVIRPFCLCSFILFFCRAFLLTHSLTLSPSFPLPCQISFISSSNAMDRSVTLCKVTQTMDVYTESISKKASIDKYSIYVLERIR